MIKTELGLISLDTVDSTNNYAMQLINDDKAYHGLTVQADRQTQGKGQRGRVWQSVSGESLLMSVILVPKHALSHQFVFSAGVAVTIANVLQKYTESKKIQIKWPNDIIVSDKKAGGVLIENVLQGSRWVYSVVGIGINICQDKFSDELFHATSLKMATGKKLDIIDLCVEISKSVTEYAAAILPIDQIMSDYNKMLFKRNCSQKISDNTKTWTVLPKEVRQDGVLLVQNEDGAIVELVHGHQTWLWG
jgi:BirA family biotin operon repressor/biotin-[acetyl-CoA-carboxylase] ligase